MEILILDFGGEVQKKEQGAGLARIELQLGPLHIEERYRQAGAHLVCDGQSY